MCLWNCSLASRSETFTMFDLYSNVTMVLMFSWSPPTHGISAMKCHLLVIPAHDKMGSETQLIHPSLHIGARGALSWSQVSRVTIRAVKGLWYVEKEIPSIGELEHWYWPADWEQVPLVVFYIHWLGTLLLISLQRSPLFSRQLRCLTHSVPESEQAPRTSMMSLILSELIEWIYSQGYWLPSICVDYTCSCNNSKYILSPNSHNCLWLIIQFPSDINDLVWGTSHSVNEELQLNCDGYFRVNVSYIEGVPAHRLIIIGERPL